MNTEQLLAKREAILKSLGKMRETFVSAGTERTTQYSDQEKALAILDQEIAAAQASSTGRFGLASCSKT